MRLIYATEDPTKIGGAGPILHVTSQNALKVATVAAQVSAAPSSSAIITTAADIVLAAGNVLRIQNLDTDPLFVKRGTGASTTSANYVLAGGTGADDGKGGTLVIADFVGTVSFAGTTPRYLAWK